MDSDRGDPSRIRGSLRAHLLCACPAQQSTHRGERCIRCQQSSGQRAQGAGMGNVVSYCEPEEVWVMASKHCLWGRDRS
jgi:hypothetical protein